MKRDDKKNRIRESLFFAEMFPSSRNLHHASLAEVSSVTVLIWKEKMKERRRKGEREREGERE